MKVGDLVTWNGDKNNVDKMDYRQFRDIENDVCTVTFVYDNGNVEVNDNEFWYSPKWLKKLN